MNTWLVVYAGKRGEQMTVGGELVAADGTEEAKRAGLKAAEKTLQGMHAERIDLLAATKLAKLNTLTDESGRKWLLTINLVPAF